MKALARSETLALLVVAACVALPQCVAAQTFVLDPTCGVVPPFNTQVVDGNGMPLAGPPLTCYPPLGMGLAELLPVPGPPLNDDIGGFEWSAPGMAAATGIGFSLAPGSPTLTPG